MKQQTKVLFVRIPQDWLDKINQIAKEECRTQVSVARQAIKEFLERRVTKQVTLQREFFSISPYNPKKVEGLDISLNFKLDHSLLSLFSSVNMIKFHVFSCRFISFGETKNGHNLDTIQDKHFLSSELNRFRWSQKRSRYSKIS